MNHKAFALIGALLIVGGALLCCSVFTDDSEAAFSSHQSSRGVMYNSTPNNATTGGVKVYGTILNPYTGIDVDLRTMSGGHNVFVKTGSQVRIVTGNTTNFHNQMISLGWSYSNGVYTCTVNNNMHVSNSGSSVYLNGNYINVQAISNPGFIGNGEYWYCGTSATEPALGVNISDIGYLLNKDSTIHLAVGASVYIGPFPNDGEQWINSNSIGLSQNGNGSITGTVSATGSAGFGCFDAVAYDEASGTFNAVSYSDSVTVTYNANGGSCSTPSVSVNSGSSTVLPSASKAYSTFAGWFTAASGGTRVGGAGDSYTVNGATTLYAQYNVIPVSITTTHGTEYMVQGSSFAYTVGTNPADATISVSGANWLTVSNKTVTGVPTASSAPAGTYHITVTASYGTQTAVQTFDIVVAAKLIFESIPTGGIIATPV